MAECWVASGTKASGSLDTLNRWSLPQFQTRSSDLAYASNPLEQIRVKRRKELHDLFSSRFGQTTPLSRSLRWEESRTTDYFLTPRNKAARSGYFSRIRGAQ